MMRMPAFRAAGMAWSRSCAWARSPLLFFGRPSWGERKKFCMSIMQRADFEGEMVMSAVVVLIVTRAPAGGLVGVTGWVRSKPFLLS